MARKPKASKATLTLLGVTKPVKLTATSFSCGPNPFSEKEMCGADLVASVKRTDFRMKFRVLGDQRRSEARDRRRGLQGLTSSAKETGGQAQRRRAYGHGVLSWRTSPGETRSDLRGRSAGRWVAAVPSMAGTGPRPGWPELLPQYVNGLRRGRTRELRFPW